MAKIIYEHSGRGTSPDENQKVGLPLQGKRVHHAYHTTENGYGVAYLHFEDGTSIRIEADGYASWIDIRIEG